MIELISHRIVPLVPAILILLAGWPSACISAAADPVVEQCLTQYERTLNRLENVYLEGEITREAIGRYYPPNDNLNDKKGTTHYAGSFATDGTRFCLRSCRWGHDRGPAARISSRAEGQYESILWRPDLYHQYIAAAAKPGTLFRAENREEIKKRRGPVSGENSGKNVCCWVLGYFGPYVFAWEERLDRVLRASQLSQSRKSLNGRQCICLSGRTKCGAFNAYFEENAPHHLLQLKTVKKPGSLYGKQPLPKDNLITTTNVFSDYKDFGGVVVPARCATVIDHTMPYNLYLHSEVSCRITKLQLAPDFQAIKAFEPTDIREGAKVSIAGRTGAKYTWHNTATGHELRPGSNAVMRKRN